MAVALPPARQASVGPRSTATAPFPIMRGEGDRPYCRRVHVQSTVVNFQTGEEGRKGRARRRRPLIDELLTGVHATPPLQTWVTLDDARA